MSKGFRTRFPFLPNANWPNLEHWINELEKVWREFEDPQKLTVVCHSLSGVLWLHFAKRRKRFLANQVILVAPPGPGCDLGELDQFFPVPLDSAHIKRSSNSTILICTNADPFCPEQDIDFFGRSLGIETVLLPDSAIHINNDSGFGPWPMIENICLTGQHFQASKNLEVS